MREPKGLPVLVILSLAIVGGFTPAAVSTEIVQSNISRSVNLSLNDGEFIIHSVDLPARKDVFPLEFARTYRSITATSASLGPVGYNWDTSYNRRLRVDPKGEIVLMDGLSRILRFRPSIDKATYISPSPYRVHLTRNSDGSFVYRDLASRTTTFAAPDSTGIVRMTNTVDTSGSQLTFSYDNQGRLSRVIDKNAHSLEYVYNDSKLLTTLKASDGRQVKFQYDDKARLIGVTNAAGKTVRYSYSDAKGEKLVSYRLTSVSTSRSDPQGKPIGVTFEYLDSGKPPNISTTVSARMNLDQCGLWEDFDAGGNGIIGGDCVGGECAGTLLGMLHPDLLIWKYKGGGKPSEGCFIGDGGEPPPPPPPEPPPPPPPEPPCPESIRQECEAQGFAAVAGTVPANDSCRACEDYWSRAETACENCMRSRGCEPRCVAFNACIYGVNCIP